MTPKIKWLWDSQRSAALLWAPQTKHHQKSQRPVSQKLNLHLSCPLVGYVSGGLYNKSIFEHLCLACVCVYVIGGVHLCNPDLVRQSTLDCGWTQPLVTYYYSFSCRSKYWFIKGFSIWAPWHVVKYHQVCTSEQRDREGGGQVRSPGIVDHPLRHPPTRAPFSLVLIYLYNSKTLHFYQFEAIEWSMSSYSLLLTTECCSSSLAYQTRWSLSSYVLCSYLWCLLIAETLTQGHASKNKSQPFMVAQRFQKSSSRVAYGF